MFMMYFIHDFLTNMFRAAIAAFFRVMLLLKEYKRTNVFSCVTFTSEHYNPVYTSPARYIKTHHIAISSITPHRLNNFNSQYFNNFPF